MTLQHLRSSTANKRPLPGSMSDGQIAINTNTSSPGLFFKDSAGALVKVGPVHVGSTAPNASPASGGETGNTVGEQWLDTSGSTYVFKIWDGSAWRSESGTFVDAAGDVMTGALGIIAGSAGSPGLYFSGDTNTGIYSPGADQVAISTNGTGRLFVDASGSVNVGTSASPTVGTFARPCFYLKQLSDPANAFGAVHIEAFGEQSVLGIGYDGTAQTFAFDTSYRATGAYRPIAFKTSNTERLRITSAGLVGVGNSSPSYKLDVTGDIRSTATGYFATGLAVGTASPGYALDVRPAGVGQARVGSQDNQAGFYLSSGNSTNPFFSFLSSTSTLEAQIYGVAGSAALVFATGASATERARIDSSGRLLVGTSSSPSSGASYSLGVFQGNTSSSAGSAEINLQRGETASLITSGEPLGTINFTDSSGNIFGWVQCSADASAGTNDYPGRLVFSTTADGASSPTERMRISQNGLTRIFVTNGDGFQSDISVAAGTATATFVGRHSATGIGNGTTSFIVWSNGNVVNTNNSYGAISDIKLKENIVDATSQWSDIKALQVRKYNFKEGQTHTQIGLVAQEAELVSPGLVSESPDRDAEGNDLGTVTKSVNYSVLYMKAVKALQEAMERIEQLEQRLTDAGIA